MIMKNYFVLLLLSLPLLFWACKDDDGGGTTILPPAVTITANFAEGSDVCVGQTIEMSIVASADAMLNTFQVFRNMTESVDERQDLFLNTFTFSLSYTPGLADLTAGSVSFDVEVSDLDGKTAMESISFNIVTEFAFDVASFSPTPAYDLANNMALASADGADVDMAISIESQDCGPFCTNYRYTLKSNNATRFYSLPANTPIRYFLSDFKQADVEAAIAGLTPESEFVVYSNLSEDLVGGGPLNKYPIVAELRGTGEFAIIGTIVGGSAPEDFAFSYKKRTEFAGN